MLRVFFLGFSFRLFLGVESRWVWWSVIFFWVSSYVLLVFPLFWGNFCRRSQWRGESSRYNYLRTFPWSRLISLSICKLCASTWCPGRCRGVHIRCGSALWECNALGLPFLCVWIGLCVPCWIWLVSIGYGAVGDWELPESCFPSYSFNNRGW